MDTPKPDLAALLNELILQSYRMEREFRDYKALYESVLEIIPQAIWVLNSDNTIFYANKIAQNLTKILQKSQNFPPDPKNSEIFVREKTFLIQRENLTENSRQIITATDITAQKRNERLIAMGQISAHLAHEIRNPIGSISLLASTLQKKIDKKNAPLISEIQKSLWRVERQIRATLLFSRGVTLRLAPQNIAVLGSEADEIVSQYSFSKTIDFRYDFPDLEWIFDFDLFGIVLQNFIYNAIDAIEESDAESGTIEILAKKQRENLVFFVSDDGVKISDKNALFEPFVSTKIRGNGLGLSLSREIVKAHGGEISLQSAPRPLDPKNPRKKFTKTFKITISCQKNVKIP